jgi:PAT family beta-lactamase induction signal transducer AmpG
MLALGFSAGLPLLLIFSSLSLWLREAGLDKSAVTYFSWAALGYSFKFVWAPLVDRLPVPLLTRALGLRRSWLLLAQLGVTASIALMAFTDPGLSENHLALIALGAVLLGFSSATQDIVIDAYRIEAADSELQGLMSAAYIAGYRTAMIAAGAGALFLASHFGSTPELYKYEAWEKTYLIMSSFMLVGIATTLLIHEPVLDKPSDNFSNRDYARLVVVFLLAASAFVGLFYFSSELVAQTKSGLVSVLGGTHLASFLIEALRLITSALIAFFVAVLAVKVGVAKKQVVSFSYVEPIKNFFESYGGRTAWLLLGLVGLYRISDIVLGVISNVFYQDMGFTKNEIAEAVKLFGLLMTILGGFVGGVLAMRVGVLRMLMLGAVLVVLTNLLFISLVYSGHDMRVLYLVVAADNLVAGLATAAFVAFLSSLVDVRFTAMQYAIFSSLMTLIPKLIGGYSGSIVDAVGYTQFFLIASAMGLPVLLLVVLAGRALEIRHAESD